jgi:hypothetical protein
MPLAFSLVGLEKRLTPSVSIKRSHWSDKLIVVGDEIEVWGACLF